MEHRLLYRGQASNPQEHLESLHTSDEKNVILERSRNQMNPLSEQTTQHRVNQLNKVTNDPKERDRLWQDLTTGMESRIDANAERYTEMLAPEGALRARLTANYGDKLNLPVLEEIMDILQKRHDEKHPYLTKVTNRKQGDIDTWSHYYNVNFPAMEPHRQWLNRYKHKDPDIMMLDAGLDAIAQEDRFHYAHYEWNHRTRANNYSDRAIWKMLGMTGIIVFGALALVTGIYALNQKEKKSLVGPALLAGLALFCVPQFRQMCFGQAREGEFNRLAGILGNQHFKDIRSDYHMEGENSQALAERIMAKDSSVKAFEKLLAHTVPQDMPDKVQEFVQEMMPNDAQGQENLQRMIMDNRFGDFTATLRTAHTRDVRDAVAHYMGTKLAQGRQDISTVQALQNQQATLDVTPPPSF